MELWEKCYREIKGNKDKCIQSQAQTGHQSGQCDFIGNREQNMGGACLWKTLRKQAKFGYSQPFKDVTFYDFVKNVKIMYFYFL